jgi:hypothetical protein
MSTVVVPPVIKSAASDVLRAFKLLGGFLTALKSNSDYKDSIGVFSPAKPPDSAAFEKDYDNGKAVIVGSFGVEDSYGSTVCYLFAVKKGSLVYNTLAGENAVQPITPPVLAPVAPSTPNPTPVPAIAPVPPNPNA